MTKAVHIVILRPCVTLRCLRVDARHNVTIDSGFIPLHGVIIHEKLHSTSLTHRCRSILHQNNIIVTQRNERYFKFAIVALWSYARFKTNFNASWHLEYWGAWCQISTMWHSLSAYTDSYILAHDENTVKLDESRVGSRACVHVYSATTCTLFTFSRILLCMYITNGGYLLHRIIPTFHGTTISSYHHVIHNITCIH